MIYTKTTINNISLVYAKDNDGYTYIGIEEHFNAKDYQYTDDLTQFIDLHNQLIDYLDGKKHQIKIDKSLKGTDFQRLVWNELMKIEYGKTTTYFDIARKINRPKSQRAVGNAIGKNPLLFVIPCHRVIKKDSSLGGFSAGVELKKQLLALEKKYKKIK